MHLGLAPGSQKYLRPARFGLLLLWLIVCHSRLINAQETVFVRVYDLKGNKVGKGFLMSVDDSSFQLKSKGEWRRFPIEEVGRLRLRRSFGNTVAYTAIGGMIVLGIAGAASADNDASFFSYTASEGFLAGGILGSIGGAATGAIISSFRNRLSIPIDGQYTNWIKAREVLRPFLTSER